MQRWTRTGWSRGVAGAAVAAGLLLTAPPAGAQDDVPTTEAAQAEYVRLSRELQRLAERNAWSGVERSYQSILSNGVPASQQDHIYGARAAKQAGNASAVRERLESAIALGENQQAYDWAWEFDSTYGRVDLACDPGTLELSTASMPFQPDLAAAVRYAQADLAEDGQFKGYLPAGDYAFGPYTVQVMPRVQSVQIDARGSIPPERPDREIREIRETRPARVTSPDPTSPAEPMQLQPDRPQGDIDTGMGHTAPASGTAAHLIAVTVGAGTRYGAQLGPGLGLLLRVPAGPIGFGLTGGAGYDVGFEDMGFHGGARLYLPDIAIQRVLATLYVGGAYSPIQGSTKETGVGVARNALYATLAGLDLRVGRVVIDLNYDLAYAPNLAPNDDVSWYPGYGAGIGVGFP